MFFAGSIDDVRLRRCVSVATLRHMPACPDVETFCQLAADYSIVPVFRRFISDPLTPALACRRMDDGGPICLFESVVGGEKVGRYSFLASAPFMEITARGKTVTVRTGDTSEEVTVDDPLAELRRRLAAYRVAPHARWSLPPFIGGAIGYAAYDIVRYTERLAHPPADDRGLPDLAFGFYDQVVIFDHVSETITIVVLARLQPGQAAPQAWREAVDRIDQLAARLASPARSLGLVELPDWSQPPQIPYRSNFTKPAFLDAVGRCVEYIRAGDIFQVVISQRLAVQIHSDPFEIYRSLRVINPSPFMFFVRVAGVQLVGSSPEIMCRVVDGRVTVRPLAGTRPRGRDEDEDRQLAAELLADPKERAEHVMLVDLGRNDVGRVAKYGSVRLSDVMSIERYSHVMHITSNVNGDLAPGKDAFDALRASLPAGTVSGAPKVRAMEIIDELEPQRRGPYAGAVGYIDYGGNMDTCIALRTMVIQNNIAYVQAGAGIVADSIPENEYQETLNKARGILKAIELTEQRQ